MIITTSQKAAESVKSEARRIAQCWSLDYEERGKRPLRDFFSSGDSIAVLSGQDLCVHFNEEQQYTFHLSMAQLRLLRLSRGEEDHLISAVQSLYGSESQSITILDCTLGLGSDSIVMSYACSNALIVGVEASFPIWLSTSYGLSHFDHSDEQITRALRRINTIHSDFHDVLASKPDGSIDIIYFDPMFEVPVQESPQFKPLRGHTMESTITDTVIQEAQRVARLGVIIKERPFSNVFKQYPPHQWYGGKYSRIGYGVYKESIWSD